MRPAGIPPSGAREPETSRTMSRRLLTSLALAALVAVGATACGSTAGDVSVTPAATTTTPDAPASPSDAPAAATFDPYAVAVGDTVAGMTIEDLAVAPDTATTFYANVTFSGRVTLTGNVHAYADDELLGDEVCLRDLDAASAAALPRLAQDERTPWLCFTNHDDAAASFSRGTTTHATVTVSDYTIHYHPSDVYDTATLASVVSRAS